MASLDSGQSGFLQQEDPGNQVCFPLLHCSVPSTWRLYQLISFTLQQGACCTPV